MCLQESISMSLIRLGWSEYFQQAISELGREELTPARVIRQDKQQYLVHNGEQHLSAILLGRLLYESEDMASLPAVGDWVCIEIFDHNQAIIHAVLPRFGAFFRKEAGHVTRKQVIASNIDYVFLVSGLDNDFNLRRIERYLVQGSGKWCNSCYPSE